MLRYIEKVKAVSPLLTAHASTPIRTRSVPVIRRACAVAVISISFSGCSSTTDMKRDRVRGSQLLKTETGHGVQRKHVSIHLLKTL